MKKSISVLLLLAAVFLCLTSFTAISFLAGDVNGDGKLAPEDARLALRASVGLEHYQKNAYAFIAADVNNDGEIKADDARSILRASVGLENLPGKIITGEERPTQVFKDKKPGEIVATTAAPTTQKPNNPSDHQNDVQPTTLPYYEQYTTVPAQPANPNEFEYLKNGNFYIQGTMTDSSGQQLPLEMAVTPNSVYMLSTFEGAAMGMLTSNGTTYMIYPAEKSYLELNATVLKAMGLSASDLVSAEDLDYSQFDLSKADAVRPAKVNGVSCREYIFYNDDPSTGSTRFYLNGNKLVRFAAYDGFGRPDTINDVGYITDNVPADKINPPADYKEYKGITDMFSFISLLGDSVGE